MNRSVERRRFRTRGILPGEVRVGRFDHPSRGHVRGSAAPLVAASLRRRGVRVSEGLLPLHDSGDAVLFAASYLDLAGDAVGFAAAAHADAPEALRAAEEAVESWSAIWRTRRLLVAAVNPLCSGARRAHRMLEHHDGPAYLVADHRLKASLESAGLDSPSLSVVDGLDHVPHRSTVVLPTYQASTPLRANAAARGLDLIDTTCPLVHKMHTDLKRFADRGDTVLIIGNSTHAVATSLISEARGTAILVQSIEDIEALRIDDPARISYLVTGGVAVEDAIPLIAALRARYPQLRGQHPNELCYAASERIGTVRAVAAACDVVLVLDTASSADARDLTELLTSIPVGAHRITDAGEIEAEWLAGAATIGLVATPSAKPRLTEDVIEAVSGLGPLSVVRRTMVSEVVKTQDFL